MPASISRLAALVAAGFLVLAVAAARAADERGKLTTTTYLVADLVVPLSPVVPVPAGPGKSREQAQPPTQEKQLIELIIKTCCPQTWSDMGGPGTIDYFPMTMSLVINQTPDVQEQVAGLLQALRRLQDQQVALEVRVVTVSEAFFERLGVDFNVQGKATESPQTPPLAKDRAEGLPSDLGLKFLNDKQVHQLIEAVQGDVHTNILQSPKITLFNGQLGTLNVADTQYFMTGLDVRTSDGKVVVTPRNEPIPSGFFMMAQPVISADRRSVQVNLKIEMKGLASGEVPLMPVTVAAEGSGGNAVPLTQFIQQPKFSSMTIEKAVSIPDGGTVVFGGMKKVVETCNEYGPPILSKIPYVNRLFKNVGTGRETQQVLVLVTPRIIIQEEEQERQTGFVEPPMKCETVKGQSLPPGSGCAVTPAVYQEPSKPTSRELAKPENSRQVKMLAKLRKAYDEACAEGRADEAKKYARAALAIDPTCFQRQH